MTSLPSTINPRRRDIMTEYRLDPIEDLVGDLFVDRHDELRMCREWVERIPRWHLNSFAFVGRRRTGKTAILVKFFNELFHTQDRVIPVFISFARYLGRREAISYYDFAREYFGGYMRSYLAFRHRKPRLFGDDFDLSRLRRFARQVNDEYAIDLYDHYEGILAEKDISAAHGLAQWVINFPMGYARMENMPTAIIIDEFQVLTDVYDPRQDLHHDLTDSFQRASETHWAPLLVSGSAVTLLMEEALGGLLSGRIVAHHLGPLAREHTHDLVFRLAENQGLKVTEAFAEAVWQLTGGYPYSVRQLMVSPCAERHAYPSTKALEALMRHELTNPSGGLWQHYRREFHHYSRQLNEGPLTRNVVLWATKYPDERIDPDRLAEDLGAGVGEVLAALEKLQWIDVVQRTGLISYQGPGDPMLRRYVEYQHAVEIEKLAPAEAVRDWHEEYKRLRGRMSNFIGEVAEVYVEGVMRAFDGRDADGAACFNTPGTVRLPVFKKVERRGGIVKRGIPVEIDLTGECAETKAPYPEEPLGGSSAWLVQVKYTSEPIGPDDIRKFLNQTDQVISEKGYTDFTRWYFSKRGYTGDAEKCLQQAGVLYSSLAQFNALAKLVGFFGLPE